MAPESVSQDESSHGEKRGENRDGWRMTGKKRCAYVRMCVREKEILKEQKERQKITFICVSQITEQHKQKHINCPLYPLKKL